jgi:DNA (cytosine-5)-methyltransferase 1
MNYFSMFSGVGGFENGIERAYSSGCISPRDARMVHEDGQSESNTEGCVRRTQQAVCVGYSEIDPYAASIYKHHYPEHKNYGDATTINWGTVPDFDMLVGGVPCQAWSVAGKREGFEDSRGTLWFEYFRCLKEKQPKLFVAENVKGILSHNKGASFEEICVCFCELGYAIDFEVLNSKNFGVPQNRTRVFIVGIREDLLGDSQIF